MQTKFKNEISKEELVGIPLGKYTGEIQLISKPKAARAALNEIKKCPVIGIDTESRPAFKKGTSYAVSLVQIATDKKVYLFRILKTGFLKEMIDVLEDSNLIKIGIAPRDDLKDLQKLKSFTPQSVIDLNLFAQKRGFVSIGAKKLSALVLGIRISKAQQVSNWELPSLSQAQIDYAATDAWICLAIYLKLIQAN